MSFFIIIIFVLVLDFISFQKKMNKRNIDQVEKEMDLVEYSKSLANIVKSFLEDEKLSIQKGKHRIVESVRKQIIGEGRVKSIYHYYLPGDEKKICGFECDENVAAHFFLMSRISPNFVECIGIGKENTLITEFLIEPKDFFIEDHFDEEGGIKIFAQVFFTFLISCNVFGVCRPVWTPTHNIGFRIAKNDCELDYSILGPMIGMKSIKIKFKKNDPIIVFNDHSQKPSGLPVFKNSRSEILGQFSFLDNRIVTPSNMDYKMAYRFALNYTDSEKLQLLNEKMGRLISGDPRNNLSLLRYFLEKSKKEYSWIDYEEGEIVSAKQMLEIIKKKIANI